MYADNPQVTIAKLTSAPQRDEDGLVWAEAEVGVSETPCDVRIATRGGWVPYAVGDIVDALLLEADYGLPPIVVGLHADASVAPQAAGNTEYRAREGGNLVLAPARGGGWVLIGLDADGADTEYEALALHPRIAAELVNLKAQIDALANRVEGLTAAAGLATIGVGAVAAVTAATITGGITGGDAAAGAKGAKG